MYRVSWLSIPVKMVVETWVLHNLRGTQEPESHRLLAIFVCATLRIVKFSTWQLFVSWTLLLLLRLRYLYLLIWDNFLRKPSLSVLVTWCCGAVFSPSLLAGRVAFRLWSIGGFWSPRLQFPMLCFSPFHRFVLEVFHGFLIHWTNVCLICHMQAVFAFGIAPCFSHFRMLSTFYMSACSPGS